MKNYHTPLLPGETYHMFNRAIGDEKLFRTNENYRYFLKRFNDHTSNIGETFCYCLLPNHFHLMIRMKPTDEIKQNYQLVKKATLPVKDQHIMSDFLMERFSNWLNGYTKAVNKMFHRKGGLFIDYTKRIRVYNDHDFSKLIHYIHANPVHHGCCKHIADWKHSSYHSLLYDWPTMLQRAEVIDWFGSADQFREVSSTENSP